MWLPRQVTLSSHANLARCISATEKQLNYQWENGEGWADSFECIECLLTSTLYDNPVYTSCVKSCRSHVWEWDVLVFVRPASAAWANGAAAGIMNKVTYFSFDLVGGKNKSSGNWGKSHQKREQCVIRGSGNLPLPVIIISFYVRGGWFSGSLALLSGILVDPTPSLMYLYPSLLPLQ